MMNQILRARLAAVSHRRLQRVAAELASKMEPSAKQLTTESMSFESLNALFTDNFSKSELYSESHVGFMPVKSSVNYSNNAS
jgi:hypothetical protein